MNNINLQIYLDNWWLCFAQTIQYLIPATENVHKILIQPRMGNSMFPFPLHSSSMPLGRV